METITNGDFNEQLQTLLGIMAQDGIYSAARGISSMIGVELKVTAPTVQLVPIFDIPTLLGGPETEAVGIYLRAEGQLTGHVMLIIPIPKALELVDLMMEEKPGTTTHLGQMERSALAELGNLTATYFMNAVAKATGLEIRPTPPAVMVDMIGAVLDIILTTSDGISENVLMLQADFSLEDRQVEVDFWVIPDRLTLEAIGRRESQRNV